MNLGVECEIYVLKLVDGRLRRPRPDRHAHQAVLRRARVPAQLPVPRPHGDADERARLGRVLVRPRGRERPVRVRFPLRRRAHHVRPLRLLALHGEARRRGVRPGRDVHAQAVRRQDRQRRALQHEPRPTCAAAPISSPRSRGEDPARARPLAARLPLHRRPAAPRARAVRRAGADGEQLQAPHPARRDELLLVGAGLQFVRHQQPLELDPRADGRRALRVSQRRLVAEPVSRRDALSGRRPRGHPRAARPRRAARREPLRVLRRAARRHRRRSRCRARSARRSRPSPPIRSSSACSARELRDEFIRYKRAEWEEYHQHVSDWEIKRYAQFF